MYYQYQFIPCSEFQSFILKFTASQFFIGFGDFLLSSVSLVEVKYIVFKLSLGKTIYKSPKSFNNLIVVNFEINDE